MRHNVHVQYILSHVWVWVEHMRVVNRDTEPHRLYVCMYSPSCIAVLSFLLDQMSVIAFWLAFGPAFHAPISFRLLVPSRLIVLVKSFRLVVPFQLPPSP